METVKTNFRMQRMNQLRQHEVPRKRSGPDHVAEALPSPGGWEVLQDPWWLGNSPLEEKAHIWERFDLRGSSPCLVCLGPFMVQGPSRTFKVECLAIPQSQLVHNFQLALSSGSIDQKCL